MPTITVPLEDILTDPESPVDLTTLPADEALATIKEMYSFLPSIVDVSVAKGIVSITIPDEEPRRIDEARRTYERAVATAEGGKYRRAIKMLRDVVKVLPADTEARRNLGMAHMESGNSRAAKDHLVQALRLNPNDAWAYLILGNLLLQVENDPDSAERCYQRGHELDPNDAYILNSYAALKAKRKEFAEARALFEKAIDIDPNYPNPRYGLALCHAEKGEAEMASATLDELFAAPESPDPRSEPVYEQARVLYLDLNQGMAQDNRLEMMGRLEDIIEEFAAHTGYPIDLQEDNSLSVSASAQLAWVHKRTRHIIKYKPTTPAVLPHRVAHEFDHIRLAHETREAGRSRLFVTTDGTKEFALRAVGKHVRKLRRKGFGEDMITTFMDEIVGGLANQLFNIPVDMVIEHRLYEQYDFLRSSQIASLNATHLESLQALTDKAVRDTSPAPIYQANIAMNCAYALFTDFLFNGATAYAEPYRKSNVFTTGHRLLEAWQDAMPDFKPGDEYDLVDQFAEILRLQAWYEWRPDEVPASSADSHVQPGPAGVTDPELLKEKQPAAIEYCVDALRRFEDMADDEVFQIASEIALLGRSGLDYASSEQMYTLQSLPDERFSGLRLMCYMYVGFRRVDPSLDTGLPLADAYAAALEMYQSEREQ